MHMISYVPAVSNVRRYFAPGVPGEDRTERFGEERLPYDQSMGRPVYMLIGSYEERLADLQRLYPGGEVVVDGPDSDPVFIAYLPPWPEGPPTAVPAGTPVAEDP